MCVDEMEDKKRKERRERARREKREDQKRGPEEERVKERSGFFLTVNGLAATRRVKEEGVNTPARVDVT